MKAKILCTNQRNKKDKTLQKIPKECQKQKWEPQKEE